VPTDYECGRSRTCIAHLSAELGGQDVRLAANWMYLSQMCGIFFGNALRSGLTECRCCDTRHQMMEWYLWNFTRTWWTILQKMKESCQRPVLATKQRSNISWYNIRSWWSENSHIVVEHMRECPKMIRFVVLTALKCTYLSSLGKSVNGIICSDMFGVVLNVRATWRQTKRFWTWQSAIVHLVTSCLSRSSLPGLGDLYTRPLLTFYCWTLRKMGFTFSQCP
jgi:hypothetical protein